MDRDVIIELTYSPAPPDAAPPVAAPLETEAEESSAPMAMDPAERRRRLQDDVPESIKKARAEQLALLPAPVVLP
eukprot:777350-Heterocapsa_arctica.AAC.1